MRASGTIFLFRAIAPSFAVVESNSGLTRRTVRKKPTRYKLLVHQYAYVSELKETLGLDVNNDPPLSMGIPIWMATSVHTNLE